LTTSSVDPPPKGGFGFVLPEIKVINQIKPLSLFLFVNKLARLPIYTLNSFTLIARGYQKLPQNIPLTP